MIESEASDRSFVPTQHEKWLKSALGVYTCLPGSRNAVQSSAIREQENKNSLVTQTRTLCTCVASCRLDQYSRPPHAAPISQEVDLLVVFPMAIPGKGPCDQPQCSLLRLEKNEC